MITHIEVVVRGGTAEAVTQAVTELVLGPRADSRKRPRRVAGKFKLRDGRRRFPAKHVRVRVVASSKLPKVCHAS